MVKILPFVTIASLSLGIFSSCGTVEINSEPNDAEVFLYKPGDEKPQSLGKTPLSLSLGDLNDNVDKGMVVLEVKKKGFWPSRYVVPNMNFSYLNINANLNPDQTCSYADINSIVAMVLKAEKLIVEKRYDDALKQADEIEKISGNIAAVHQVKGTVFFLQKDFEKSRQEWKSALAIQPENANSKNMLKLIETKLQN